MQQRQLLLPCGSGLLVTICLSGSAITPELPLSLNQKPEIEQHRQRQRCKLRNVLPHHCPVSEVADRCLTHPEAVQRRPCYMGLGPGQLPRPSVVSQQAPWHCIVWGITKPRHTVRCPVASASAVLHPSVCSPGHTLHGRLPASAHGNLGAPTQSTGLSLAQHHCTVVAPASFHLETCMHAPTHRRRNQHTSFPRATAN